MRFSTKTTLSNQQNPKKTFTYFDHWIIIIKRLFFLQRYSLLTSISYLKKFVSLLVKWLFCVHLTEKRNIQKKIHEEIWVCQYNIGIRSRSRSPYIRAQQGTHKMQKTNYCCTQYEEWRRSIRQSIRMIECENSRWSDTKQTRKKQTKIFINKMTKEEKISLLKWKKFDFRFYNWKKMCP